jgi:hypothetical protein
MPFGVHVQDRYFWSWDIHIDQGTDLWQTES